MIRDFEEFTGVDIFGTPYEILRGVYSEVKGFVAGYITLRTPQDFLKYKMMFRKDLVMIVSNLHKDFQKFAEGIAPLFKGTVVDFYSGTTIYGQERVNYLLFEQEHADDIFLMYTKYKTKGDAVVFKYARDGFYYNDVLQKPQDLARMSQGKQVPVIVCPKLMVNNMATKYGMIAERLETGGDYHKVEAKEYLVGTLDAVPEDEDDGYKVLPSDKPNYYGEGTFLQEAKHGTQAEVEPIELKGMQLVSHREFMQMDVDGVYESVQRIGEFPNDEVGATWFYVNKKADSFVEVYMTQSDRVYVIKAMDAVFFSKVALALEKQEDIKLELLVRDIAVLATFLLKFGHKQLQ